MYDKLLRYLRYQVTSEDEETCGYSNGTVKLTSELNSLKAEGLSICGRQNRQYEGPTSSLQLTVRT